MEGQSPEELYEQQGLDMQQEFESWFYSNEIQGDFKQACKIAKIDSEKSSYEDLSDAYFKSKEQPISTDAS